MRFVGGIRERFWTGNLRRGTVETSSFRRSLQRNAGQVFESAAKSVTALLRPTLAQDNHKEICNATVTVEFFPANPNNHPTPTK